MSKRIAAIIPCYNEAAGIAQVIEKFPRERLHEAGLELSVFVVDNNSSDNTADVAQKAGATVFFEAKKGKGNALRTGFANLPPDIDYVVMLDGDDTYSPEEVMRLIEPMESGLSDVVIGSRLGGHIQEASMSRRNHLGNQIFTGATRLFYRANMSDVLTGYFAWKKSALDELRPHIISEGFAIEMEMITKMARLNQRMVSVPISYHPRSGTSNLHPYKDGVRILMMLLRNLLWQPTTAPSSSMRTVASGPKTFIPRKIVFVSDAIYPYMKGGKEKRLFEIARRLAAMGHDVHIYTMKWWEEPEKTKIEHGITLHALSKFHEMYRGDRRTISQGLLFGLACLKLFRVKFDVLDVDHMPFFPLFSAWIVCALRGRKLYATWHEALSKEDWVNYMGQSGIVASFIERLCVRLPHNITAASEHTRDLMASIHGRRHGVELVASGIDTSLMRQVQPAPTDCDVLYVGRLVKDKNVDTLILAVKRLTASRPNIRCTIIGHGIEKPKLVKLIAQQGLRRNIKIMDPLPDATDVYAYMKAAKVFCTPSVREGFGITCLEALGCGTPVITIDSPANAARRLIKDNYSGSLVPLDITAISQAIDFWISRDQKPDVAPQVADYDWQQLAQRQAEVYMQ